MEYHIRRFSIGDSVHGGDIIAEAPETTGHIQKYKMHGASTYLGQRDYHQSHADGVYTIDELLVK